MIIVISYQKILENTWERIRTKRQYIKSTGYEGVGRLAQLHNTVYTNRLDRLGWVGDENAS